LEQISGSIINRGIAFGKVYILRDNPLRSNRTAKQINQMAVLKAALSNSSEQLDQLARITHYEMSEGISIIFEAHKLMISDPLILERATTLINKGLSAYDAYHQAANEVIDTFSKLDNDYMKNRIIDIEDAAERVLSSIENVQYEIELHFPTPRLLILDKMKPSVLINCNRDSISGIISASGSYNQHSGTIVRMKEIPTLVIRNIMEQIQENDRGLIDGDQGLFYRNPTLDFVNELLKERR